MSTHTHDIRTLIVLLNWNGSGLTLECCESLAKIENASFDVLIIDNCSEPHNVQLLEKGLLSRSKAKHFYCDESKMTGLMNEYAISSLLSYPLTDNSQLILAQSRINHGFARGCNFGALFAEKADYSHLLFLNNDTVVESSFLEILFNATSLYNIVIPQIRYYDRKNVIWNCGGSISQYGKREYYFANKDVADINLPSHPFPVSFATGCCMLMTTKFYINSGMFTEKFFFGEEDIDYALRLKKQHATVACVPASIIYHKVGSSLAGDMVKLTRKAFIHYVNRFVNMKNHLGVMWYLWLIPAIAKMMLNLHRIYKLSLAQNLSFTLKAIKAAFTKKGVEKEYFENIMRQGY
ncbi:glycosyltransferase family 2 protein [Cronobacter sakazakii]|uniref:glycosyltransferase family 2 protein n=1 Tax=Cronobacter sakazakii TaxID=28141 RepID=UPI000F5E30D9|nr:glycosyltransferase family 2 protein [Cronobacter sakazakii]RRA44185.1 glycosyltransferase family 2 protein [Cronobacter sakazakii]